MLIASVDLGCSEEVLTIIGMLSAQNIFYRWVLSVLPLVLFLVKRGWHAVHAARLLAGAHCCHTPPPHAVLARNAPR
jgi:hypothetical protein